MVSARHDTKWVDRLRCYFGLRIWFRKEWRFKSSSSHRLWLRGVTRRVSVGQIFRFWRPHLIPFFQRTIGTRPRQLEALVGNVDTALGGIAVAPRDWFRWSGAGVGWNRCRMEPDRARALSPGHSASGATPGNRPSGRAETWDRQGYALPRGARCATYLLIFWDERLHVLVRRNATSCRISTCAIRGWKRCSP
jgi:hypothetical protein